jgi:hypothetical protein
VQSDPFSLEGEAISFGPNVDGYVLPDFPLDRLALGEHQQVPFLLGSNADELSVFIPEIPNFMYPLLVRAMLDPLRPGAGDEALLLYPVGTGPGEYPTAQEALAALYSDMVFTCPTRQIARLTDQSQADAVWRYFFTQVLDSENLSRLGSFHGLELFYLFQRVADITDYVATPDDLTLQEAMQSYWTRFATTGNPNGGGMVSWPVYLPDPDPYLDLGTPIVAAEGVRTEKCDFWDGLLPPSLALGGTADPKPTLPGAKLTYQYTLVNTGRDLDGIVISSTLDVDTTFVWASDGGVRSGNVVTWAVGPFTPTQRIKRTLIVRVAEAPDDDLLESTIRVAADGGISETVTIEIPVLVDGWLNYLPVILR